MSAGMLELTHLEAMLEGDAGCEIEHTHSVCSIVVTHRLISCEFAVMVCQNNAQFKVKAMQAGATCAECETPAADCWRVVPV